MIPEFTGSGLENPHFRCAACGGHCLHHERVEIFERTEDSRDGLHVVVSAGKAEIDDAIGGNPSLRRHGLKIYFRCEFCARKSIFTIAQHKGSSLIDWLVLEDGTAS
jgi:hypothetical protein